MRVTAVRKKLSSVLGLDFTEWEAEAEDKEVSAKDKLRFLEITKSLRIAMHRHATLRSNYCKLFFFLFYMVFYSMVLFQQNVRRDFELVDFHREFFFPDGYEAGEDNFYSTEDVYEWLTDKVTTIWTDPICGNGKCEMPYEFPSYHRFGCKLDCGVQPALIPIMVNMAKDAKLAAKMAAAYKLSAQTMMASVRWNLCLDEPKRREAGLEDSCWYEEDQEFQRQHVELYRVIPGTWYVRLNGDYLGFVRADVLYYLTEEGGNVTSFDIPTEPAFETCQDRIDNAAQEANANVEGAAARRQLLSQRQAATAEATHAQLLSNLASLTDMVKGVLREEHGVRT